MPSPAEIAEALSEVQREALLCFEENIWYGPSRPSYKVSRYKSPFYRKGLLKRDDFGMGRSWSYSLTPLGLAVRKALEKGG